MTPIYQGERSSGQLAACTRTAHSRNGRRRSKKVAAAAAIVQLKEQKDADNEGSHRNSAAQRCQEI
jgi:hypothetical protein